MCTANGCDNPSQITVGNITQQMAVNICSVGSNPFSLSKYYYILLTSFYGNFIKKHISIVIKPILQFLLWLKKMEITSASGRL